MITAPSSNNAPLVSVIVPTHNAADTIVECIESLINQSYRNLEIILCNDRSTDKSYDSIEHLLSDPRITWISSDRPGACAARNTGFRRCTGDYIQFLDADDLMARNKLELQIDQIESCSNPNETVSFSALVQFRDGSPPESGERWHEDPKIFDKPMQLLCKLLLSDHYIQTGQWLLSRRLAQQTGPWDESLVADQDGEYFARVLQQAHTVLSCPEAVVYYRKAVAGQISSRTGASHFQSRLAALETKISILRERVGQEMLKAIVAEQCQRIATRSYPRSKSTSKRAVQIMEKHDCQFAPAFPTKRLAMIAKIFGWRFARWCSFIKHAGQG